MSISPAAERVNGASAAVKGPSSDAETEEVSTDDLGDSMLGSTLTRLRLALVAQAVVTGALAIAGPFDVGRWLPFVAGVAAGAVVLAWFVGTQTRSAWTMTVVFELLALAVGATGAVNGYYVPGTVLALVVVGLLVLPTGRLAFPAAVQQAPTAVRLTPPPVVSARPAPPSAPPAFPPPGLQIAASLPATLPNLPPPPPMPPGFGGSHLPAR